MTFPQERPRPQPPVNHTLRNVILGAALVMIAGWICMVSLGGAQHDETPAPSLVTQVVTVTMATVTVVPAEPRFTTVRRITPTP